MRILLVEDDESIQSAISSALASQSYVLDIASDGLAGWDLVKSFVYDLILLDVMLPKLDGISLCQRLRAENYSTPILLMTARDASADKVLGLDAGADDYVVKPIDPEELKARIRTLLRRSGGSSLPILIWGDLHLNPSNCEVDYAGQQVALTKTEFGVLELFMRNPRQIFSRGAVIEHLWAFDDPPSENTIKSHLKGLRYKLKTAGAPTDPFETIYGQGYRLNPALQNTIQNDEPPKPVQTEIAVLWERFKPANFQRLAVLEKFLIEITANSIDPDRYEQAIIATHKLVGSLGTFGLTEGSQLARELEHLLLDNRSTSPLKVSSQISSQISALVDRLRSCMEQRSGAKSVEQTLQQSDLVAARVLVVNHDPVLLTQVRHLLNPCNILVTMLQDPSQFWQTLAVNSPDLLILDLSMPNFEGIELCELVRKDRQWCWLPILFLTSHADVAMVQQIFVAGGDDYVVKPIAGSELVARIVNRLERTRILRASNKLDPD